ncbi:nuclease-related domain-containing DEAD/DEAH box helicase [Anaerovibrio sp. RM50]|uniref:nuclease-related domain-containing DEAD/DEAH box helicase n=1 Tax=Anaerovibrio sp. RM50 TaxID=1200557 RepID=UPI000481C24A|nr:NERD domain-containing protein/DEAD/DEAH box helicase [Anaerovibrio sp. RM50]
MARMIPSSLVNNHNSFGEQKVFKALEKLSDEYTVFHSVRWNSTILNKYNNNPEKKDIKTVIWGECDFTIFHRIYGILIVEVKSGGIECINGQWSYIRTDNGEKHSMKYGPLEQADRGVKYITKDLVSDILPKDEKNRQYCLVEPVVWFPSISKKDFVGKLPVEYRDEIVLYEDALDNPQNFIEKIYKFYDGINHTMLSADSCNKLIEGFAPHYQALPSLKSKREERIASFIRLTNQQSYLLDYLEEQKSATIQGAAGTGKTMIAIEKAKRLAKSGKVLFLCFNRYLKEYLQQLKNDDPEKFNGIDFYNLPQLACKKMQVPSVSNDDIMYFLDNHDHYDWEYTNIIIDEGQDFRNEEIKQLNDIAILEDGAFYVFYDKKQFVQGDNTLPEWFVKAECRLVLSLNCRNTYQIADTSGKPINLTPAVKDRSVKGDMPSFYICSDKNKALNTINKLIDQYRSAKYPYREICILTMKTEETSILSGVDKIGVHAISKERGDRSVLFTTARKFKGLESDVIIFVDIDSDSFKSNRGEEDDSKCLFYVGCSRAKINLDVVFIGDDDDLKNLCSDISDKDYPNGKIAVGRSLNVKPVVVR